MTQPSYARSRSWIPWVIAAVSVAVGVIVTVAIVLTVVLREVRDAPPVTAPLDSFALTHQDLVPEYTLENTATLRPDEPFVTKEGNACTRLVYPPVGVTGRGVAISHSNSSDALEGTSTLQVFIPTSPWNPDVSEEMMTACRAVGTGDRPVKVEMFRVKNLPRGATAVYVSQRGTSGDVLQEVTIRGVERGVALVADHHQFADREVSRDGLIEPALWLYLKQRERVLDAA